MCFACGLLPLTSADTQGHWSADPSKSLNIDSKSGVAVALSPGNVIVTYKIGNVALHSQSIVINGAAKVSQHNSL